ncbi:MAG: potassium transporter [Herpetosiphonaceae bacterium]|nr:potassium transporter [Herpetosiphonaceae bacterium]
MGHKPVFTEPGAIVTLVPPSPKARLNALVLVIGFAVIIIIGAVLLRLPISGVERSLTWSEAFFTATSATTVTGLGVITTGQDLSLFGQFIVLLLIEVGGIGFITFSTILFSLIGRRIGITERVLLSQTLGVHKTGRIKHLVVRVLVITLSIQFIGGFLLFLRWAPELGPLDAAYMAIFHAVSAFCNAGFDLYAGTDTILFGFGRDPYTLVVLMGLIMIGSLGLVAALDIISWFRTRRMMLYTKLTLVINAVILLLGVPLLFIDELFAGTALRNMAVDERVWVSAFNVVGSRTAGLTIIPMEDLSQASQLIIMVLMFIGGSPASMAGGVTTSTIAVLFVAVLSTVRGRPHAVVFGRTLPLETIAKAVSIMTVSTLVCFITTLVLIIGKDGALFKTGFEVVSAFSNTGFSLGSTGELNWFGRILIMFTMFWGRLGPLTLVVLLAQREHPTLARYPEERIVMG